MKKLFKTFLLCGAAACCALGVSACASQPQNSTITVEQLIAANE